MIHTTSVQKQMNSKSSTISRPPWEAINLVSHHLDPKTLAIASCVCKSWSIFMSSDQIWQPICTTHYPSLSILRNTDSTASYRRLYSIGYTATKIRLRNPKKPNLSLNDVVFTVTITAGNSCIATVIKPGEELKKDPFGLFRFEVDVEEEVMTAKGESDENMRIAWSVVLKGWKGVFRMMECGGKVGFDGREMEGWISEDLPAAGCCGGGGGSGMAADLKVRFSSRMKVEKVSMGILSVINWRYLSFDDGLRYLQHFLLPCKF